MTIFSFFTINVMQSTIVFFGIKDVNEIIVRYPRRQIGLCYGMKTDFSSNTIVSLIVISVLIVFSFVSASAAPSQDTITAGVGKPPKEDGKFRKPDLVELIKLDPTIRLDVRYSKVNNFVGRPLYKEERAFLQRPAAESLVKAHRNLKQYGYGLLIFDGYRPWRVTKLFWDVTPAALKKFVANPAQGSRHNRGCAVDLSLFDLKTGKEISMPSEYDEMTDRAYPSYTGGTDEQRRVRDLLKQEMEKQGFTVFSIEWWHFDYKDWKEYPVLDIDFSEIK